MKAKEKTESLPRWLKIAFTIWIVAWVPVYISFHGTQNFLWICDLCNFILLIALWTENRLLFSSQLVAVLIVDILWSVDVAMALLWGFHPIGGTEYMFYSEIPLFVRLMSLFHVFTPPLIIYAVIRLGYDNRGLILQTILTWIVLPLSYLLSDPTRNINWIYRPFGKEQTMVPLWLYFIILMAAYPLLLYLPIHGLVLLIQRWKGRD
ncbi:MAG: hypothetical protein KJP23_03225 [Deltaproteobacteria bacterium]|nr:hypothetical protein [Deltaproteobacteria bacterium]